jgi:hypothetical protein
MDTQQNKTIAITGATLIDGTGAQPVSASIVRVQGERIVDVNKVGAVTIPMDAERIDARVGRCPCAPAS